MNFLPKRYTEQFCPDAVKAFGGCGCWASSFELQQKQQQIVSPSDHLDWGLLCHTVLMSTAAAATTCAIKLRKPLSRLSREIASASHTLHTAWSVCLVITQILDSKTPMFLFVYYNSLTLLFIDPWLLLPFTGIGQRVWVSLELDITGQLPFGKIYIKTFGTFHPPSLRVVGHSAEFILTKKL